MIAAILWMAFAFAVVIALLCWKLSRQALYLSILNQCISDMLVQPKAAEAIAEEARRELIREGLVDK